MSRSISKAANLRVFGKSPVGLFLRSGEWAWNLLPTSLVDSSFMRRWGSSIQKLVRLYGDRRQYFGTFFLRNRPQIDLIKRLAIEAESGSSVRLTVLGCSNGAEVYSIVAAIRSARPNLKLEVQAIDISEDILKIAQDGLYSMEDPGLTGSPMFQRVQPSEIEKMFQAEGKVFAVQPWIRKGIRWHLFDANDSRILTLLPPQDIVVANNFLCHMTPADAEHCLRNIAKLVKPGGYLIVSGVDLDVRAKVAVDLMWKPISDSLEAIHDGDCAVRQDWPWRYWGVEPFDKKRADKVMRYTSVFQLGQAARAETQMEMTVVTA